MPKLYELSTELATINDELITAEGELSPDLEKRLDEINLAITEKSTGIRKWLAIIEGDDGMLEGEIRRLQKIKKTNENLHNRLKEYVKVNMELIGKKKIETPLGTFTISKSPNSMEIVAPDAIPDEFKDIVPQHLEVNKTRIREALDEGYEVPGAKLITDRTHLRIK